MSAPALPRRAGNFAKLVRKPGGLSLDEAVRAPDANLQSIRGQLIAEVEATVERMQALAGNAFRDGPDERALEQLYQLSNSVVGIAGAAGLRALGQVCYNLCELIDRLQTSRGWNVAAVRVHIDSLHLLCAGTADDGSEHEAIVAALGRVVARI